MTSHTARLIVVHWHPEGLLALHVFLRSNHEPFSTCYEGGVQNIMAKLMLLPSQIRKETGQALASVWNSIDCLLAGSIWDSSKCPAAHLIACGSGDPENTLSPLTYLICLIYVSCILSTFCQCTIMQAIAGAAGAVKLLQ